MLLFEIGFRGRSFPVWPETRNTGVAMHKNVETVIGRLVTDRGLLSRFAKDPRRFLRELRLELSDVEVRALAATDPRAFRALAEALDARLRKAASTVETKTETETDSIEEMKR